ncbi:MAG TPA: thioesterase [Desulfotomaculum sp.]|nr:thioesterase [Desulfotomaculum sp.]HBY03721.1 thioesterase [Desulfotomaculum sp.]
MEALLKPGILGKAEKVLEKKDTAPVYGSGSIEVFATPAMIALMENAAFSSVEPFLGGDLTTVGIYVNVRHLSATPVGVKVEAQAELTEVNGRKLVFKVTACDESKMIGSGTHERYVVSRARFLEKLTD